MSSLHIMPEDVGSWIHNRVVSIFAEIHAAEVFSIKKNLSDSRNCIVKTESTTGVLMSCLLCESCEVSHMLISEHMKLPYGFVMFGEQWLSRVSEGGFPCPSVDARNWIWTLLQAVHMHFCWRYRPIPDIFLGVTIFSYRLSHIYAHAQLHFPKVKHHTQVRKHAISVRLLKPPRFRKLE